MTNTLLICGTVLIVVGMLCLVEARQCPPAIPESSYDRPIVEVAIVGALITVDVDELQAERITTTILDELDAGRVFDGHAWRELAR